MRLHRLRDQRKGPRGRSAEDLHIGGGRPAVGEPAGEPGQVGVGARQLPHGRGDLLVVPLPAHVGRGQLEEGAALRLAEDARGVGADVVEIQVRGVTVVDGAQLRERLDRVVEEDAHRSDGVLGPVVVGDRQHGGVGDEIGAGGLDQAGHRRVVGVGHPVAPGHQLPNDLKAGQDVADGGDTDHRDMGTVT